MKFKFKRKYTIPFIIGVILIIACFAIFFIGREIWPLVKAGEDATKEEIANAARQNTSGYLKILGVSLLDSILIVVFSYGLYRAKYCLYWDNIKIRRSLHKEVKIGYENVVSITDNPDDKIFLFWGKRPSLKMKCIVGAKTKTFTVRIANPELFKTVILNEKKVHEIKGN